MTMSRESHKCERVTLTLVPRTDERTLLHIPSTFNKVERTYAWRTAGALNYMLVPTRISSNEIKVDLFVDPLRKGKSQLKNIQKAVQDLVHEKIQTEWRGMKLESISRATVAVPPTSTIVRGTIEEILGASFER